jgi:hypothetical protein
MRHALLGRSHWRIVGPSLIGLGVVLSAFSSAAADEPRPLVHIAYFVPTDRQPEPEFRERIDRVMADVQRFYREGMQQNGYGPLTFELDRDADGKPKIHVVNARGPMSDYGRNDAAKVRTEVLAALSERDLNLAQETVLVFQLLLEWQGTKAIERGPYVGGGSPRGGMAYVYDDAKLDTRLLGSTDPGGYYHRPCSIGEFNTHYIGGVVHELGHGFGLPHVGEAETVRQKLGRSLMGNGNHTYGQELRGEGKGAFLAPASALQLSVHPLFTGRRLPLVIMNHRLENLSATFEAGTMVVSGRLVGGPKLIGLAAFNDPDSTPSNYDAIGSIAPIAADGTFRIEIAEFKPGDYELRLTAFADTGDSRTYAIRYPVDESGQPDVLRFHEYDWQLEAAEAFRLRHKARMVKLVEVVRQHAPADNVTRRKVEHRLNLLSPTPLLTLADIAETKQQVSLTDVKTESATTGWGQAVRNQVLASGDASGLLEVGSEFFESGFYAHAPARHVFRPDARWKTLTAQYGLQNGHDGSVVFVVNGDGRELFRSAVVRDHQARELSVDIAGVAQLELVVENAGNGNTADWGVWLRPTLKR